MAPPRSVKKQMEREEEDSGGEVGGLGNGCEASVETPFGYLQTLPAERALPGPRRGWTKPDWGLSLASGFHWGLRLPQSLAPPHPCVCVLRAGFSSRPALRAPSAG